MSAIIEAAREVREVADRLEKLAITIRFNSEADCLLSEAVQTLAGVLQSGHCLKLTIWNHGDGPRVVWEVWDGAKAWTALTLEGVVAAVVAAHASRSSDPLADAQTILDLTVANPTPF